MVTYIEESNIELKTNLKIKEYLSVIQHVAYGNILQSIQQKIKH